MPNLVLAIDPGPTQSAYVLWDGAAIHDKAILPNDELLEYLRVVSCDRILIEMIASYGMAVGREVFETCLWIGRYIQICESEGHCPDLIYRKDVKLHHCQSPRANDSNIRTALVDKYGAPGTKKNPGITYGLSKDLWAAFAIATMHTESQVQEVAA